MTELGFVIMYTPDVAKKMAFYERAFDMQKGRLADKAVPDRRARTLPQILRWRRTPRPFAPIEAMMMKR